MSRLKRSGTALTLLAFALAGLSGGHSATAAASQAAAPARQVFQEAVGRQIVDPSQHTRVLTPARTVVKSTAPAKAPAKSGKPVAKKKPATSAPTLPTSATPSVKASKPKTKVPVRTSVKARPKPVGTPKPAVKPAPKAPSKAVTKPKAKPAPKPAPVKQAAPAFRAPTVTYAGATCRKTGPGKWTITHRWTASGGTYADLGSGQHRTSPVTVTGGTRTWTFNTTETGSSAPEVTDAYLGRIIAPIGRAGDVTQWRSIERSADMVPAHC